MPFTRAYAKPGDSRTIVYEDDKGNKTNYQNGSRSWRNNNPGNIIKGKWADKHGAIGDDGAMAVFPDYETGRAALEALLKGVVPPPNQATLLRC